MVSKLLLIVASAALALAAVFPDGSCGPANTNTCTGSAFGRCCSQYGWCGNTDIYCGAGCQPGYGGCGTTPPPTSSAAPPAPSSTLIDTRFPNLIIPLNSSAPNTAYGTQYRGTIAYSNNKGAISEVATEVAFDNLPANGARTCRLNFFIGTPGTPNMVLTGIPLPLRFNVYNIPLNPNGPFNRAGGWIEQTDTWSTHPPIAQNQLVTTISIDRGGVTVPAHSVPCNFGSRNQYQLRGTGSANGLLLDWFELRDPKNGFVLEMWS